MMAHVNCKFLHLAFKIVSSAIIRNNGINRNEVLTERQRRTQGRVYSVDDPERWEVKMDFEPRRLPPPREFTESIWAEVNRLRHEILTPQTTPQYDTPRDDRLHDHHRSSRVPIPG